MIDWMVSWAEPEPKKTCEDDDDGKETKVIGL